MKSENNIPDQKIELIKWVSSLENKSIIEKLLQLKKTETKNWWATIQDQEKRSILQGIEDAENNKLNPHSSVRRLYEKWL